jgi:hypothetical protein
VALRGWWADAGDDQKVVVRLFVGGGVVWRR